MSKYADMYLIYEECRLNAAKASRVYAEKYPNRRHPQPNVFIRLDARIRTENRLAPGKYGARLCDARDPATEKDILRRVEADPSTSCRKLEREIGVPKLTVNWILLSNSLLITKQQCSNSGQKIYQNVYHSARSFSACIMSVKIFSYISCGQTNVCL